MPGIYVGSDDRVDFRQHEATTGRSPPVQCATASVQADIVFVSYNRHSPQIAHSMGRTPPAAMFLLPAIRLKRQPYLIVRQGTISAALGLLKDVSVESSLGLIECNEASSGVSLVPPRANLGLPFLFPTFRKSHAHDPHAMNSESLQSNNPLCPRWVWVTASLVFLTIAVPLFVCSPVTSDTSLFDVQALTAMKGGVLYRDVLEPNLPGIVWVHIALRSVIGWSSEAIRMADLLIFGLTIFLLSRLLKECRCGGQQIHTTGFIAVCTLFYLTRNEWCHCQRDLWMLLPTSCALWLRCHRTQADWKFPGAAIVEGAFWGIAFWIKPHVAIPVIAILLVDCRQHASWKLAAKDVLLVVAGGIAAAIPGIVWLIVTGAWSHFWEMMLEWNPEYLATGRTRRSVARISMMLERFYPWWILHLAAVPLACIVVYRASRPRDEFQQGDRGRVIIAVAYVAWLCQTFLLQHAMDYIHVPEILLAIFVISAHPWQLDLGIRRMAVGFVLGLALIVAPQFSGGRTSVWNRCFSEGSTPEVRSVLAQGNYPGWIHLDKVREFLAGKDVEDGDVACLNVHSIHLHQELKVLPATRYWSISHPLTMYPTRYDHIMTAVEESDQKYVVVEDNETNHEGQILPQSFPFDLPVVFESGSYKVYAANRDAQSMVARNSDANMLETDAR